MRWTHACYAAMPMEQSCYIAYLPKYLTLYDNIVLKLHCYRLCEYLGERDRDELERDVA